MDTTELVTIVLNYANNHYIKEDVHVIDNYGNCNLDLKPIETYIFENNNNWNTELGTTISQDSFVGNFKGLIKRTIRKSVHWYINPMHLKQNSFNRTVTLSLNETINKFYHLQGIINLIIQKFHEQKNEYYYISERTKYLEEEMDKHNHTLNKPINEIKYSIEDLYSEISNLKKQNEHLQIAIENLQKEKYRGGN